MSCNERIGKQLQLFRVGPLRALTSRIHYNATLFLTFSCFTTGEIDLSIVSRERRCSVLEFTVQIVNGHRGAPFAFLVKSCLENIREILSGSPVFIFALGIVT